MSDFFQQKRENEQKFRTSLDLFMQQLPFLSSSNQFTPEVLPLLFEDLKLDSMISQGKIDLTELYTIMKEQQGSHILNKSDFFSIFGTKKQIKISEFSDILKKYELNTFSICDESEKYFWEDGKFSYKRLDELMKKYGMKQLNQTNKELLMKSFDYDDDKKITREDMNNLVALLEDKKGKKK